VGTQNAAGLLAILAKSIAITIAIILLGKVLQY